MASLAHAQNLPQLWTCEVSCGTVSTVGFKPKVARGGLLDVKRAKENSRTFKPIKIWPLGYEFKLDAPGHSRPVSTSEETFGCIGSGETAEKAIQNLENRITGKNLSIIARKCDGCSLAHLKNAMCDEIKSGMTVSYSVLKSRLNPAPSSDDAQSDSTSTSTATQAH
jgi:hypothetical protein